MDVFVMLCACFVGITHGEAVSLETIRLKRQISSRFNSRERYFDNSNEEIHTSINTRSNFEDIATHGVYPIHISKNSPFHPDRLNYEEQQETSRFRPEMNLNQQRNSQTQVRNYENIYSNQDAMQASYIQTQPFQDTYETTRVKLGSVKLQLKETSNQGNVATINIGDLQINPVPPKVDEFGTVHIGSFKITPASRSTINIGGFKIENTAGTQFQIKSNLQRTENQQFHIEQPNVENHRVANPNVNTDSYISRPEVNLNRLSNQHFHHVNTFSDHSGRNVGGVNLIDPRIDRSDPFIYKSDKFKRFRENGYHRKNATNTGR